MRTSLLAALAFSLAGAAQAADFEGVIDARITMISQGPGDSGSGTIRMQVGGPGARVEMQMVSPMGEVKMTALHLKAKPGVTYLISDEKKAYSEIEEKAGDQDEPEDQVTVQKVGKERVAGYDCVHALITDAKGGQLEIWTSPALGGAEAFWTAQGGEDRRGTRKYRSVARALRDAGVDGWPLKFKSPDKKGRVTQWETTKVERKSLPASLFSLAGYTKADQSTGPVGSFKLSPEQQKKMEEVMKQQQEAMKQMTPEQRKQMEEVMKSMQGGNGGK
jgi:Domain of unknown function (DUF4412)